ncbi:ABC transporter substrate-binding protein [Nodularia chucula]|uniref:ABC transporter substrate-binding protein n=1 Tax=Nodularia chucula TaxID=3093667 RepID=UPI0039C63011
MRRYSRLFFTPQKSRKKSHKFRFYSRKLLLLLFVGIVALAGCQTLRTANTNVVHLTLWQGVNPPANRDVLDRLVDKFNQTHANIQVESLYAGQQDQQTPKILAAVVGNAPPDLLWYNPTIAGQLVELQALIPLDEQLNNSPVKAEIDPALFESMEYQGKIWSVPFATNNLAVYYRPSLFEAAGITELPRTWEQFREVAKKLTRDTNNDGRIDQYGMFLPLGKGEFTVFTWLPFMWSGGGELVQGDVQEPGGVMLENNASAIAALQFWRNLIDDGSAILSGPERGYETGDLIAGNVAMQVTGPWSLGEFTSSGVDFDVFPIPMNQEPATSIGGENLFLFKTTPEREKAAFTFAEYAMSAEFQTELALGTGYLPINIKSRQDPQYQQFVQEIPPIQVFLDQAKYGRSRPIFPGYNRISDSLGRAIESVLLGQNSPEEALEITQKRLDLIFN